LEGSARAGPRDSGHARRISEKTAKTALAGTADLHEELDDAASEASGAFHPTSARTRSSASRALTASSKTTSSGPRRSCRLKSLDRCDLLAREVLGAVQLVVALQVDPELRRGPEALRETQRGVGCDPPLTVHDLVDPPGRHTDTGSLFCVMPKPSMKSSMRTSPVWIG